MELSYEVIVKTNKDNHAEVYDWLKNVGTRWFLTQINFDGKLTILFENQDSAMMFKLRFG